MVSRTMTVSRLLLIFKLLMPLDEFTSVLMLCMFPGSVCIQTLSCDVSSSKFYVISFFRQSSMHLARKLDLLLDLFFIIIHAVFQLKIHFDNDVFLHLISRECFKQHFSLTVRQWWKGAWLKKNLGDDWQGNWTWIYWVLFQPHWFRLLCRSKAGGWGVPKSAVASSEASPCRANVNTCLSSRMLRASTRGLYVSVCTDCFLFLSFPSPLATGMGQPFQTPQQQQQQQQPGAVAMMQPGGQQQPVGQPSVSLLGTGGSGGALMSGSLIPSSVVGRGAGTIPRTVPLAAVSQQQWPGSAQTTTPQQPWSLQQQTTVTSPSFHPFPFPRCLSGRTFLFLFHK